MLIQIRTNSYFTFFQTAKFHFVHYYFDKMRTRNSKILFKRASNLIYAKQIKTCHFEKIKFKF